VCSPIKQEPGWPGIAGATSCFRMNGAGLEPTHELPCHRFSIPAQDYRKSLSFKVLWWGEECLAAWCSRPVGDCHKALTHGTLGNDGSASCRNACCQDPDLATIVKARLGPTFPQQESLSPGLDGDRDGLSKSSQTCSREAFAGKKAVKMCPFPALLSITPSVPSHCAKKRRIALVTEAPPHSRTAGTRPERGAQGTSGVPQSVS